MALPGPRNQPGRLPPVPLFVNPEFQDHYDQVRQYNFESTLRAPPVPLFVNPELENVQPQPKEPASDFQPPKSSSPPPNEIPQQVPQQIARQPQFQQKPYQPPEPEAYNRQRQQNWQGENDNQRPDYRKKIPHHHHQHQHHASSHQTHQIPHHHHHHQQHHHHQPQHQHQQIVQAQLQFPTQFHQPTQHIPQQIQHIAVPTQSIPVQPVVAVQQVQQIQVQQPTVAQAQSHRRLQDSGAPETPSIDPGIAALLAVVPTAKIASGPPENDYDREDEGESRAVYCYNCGGTDHTVKNCKKPLFCTHCSKWGHTSNVCFKKKGDNPFNKTLDEVKAKAEGEAPPPPREARFKGCFNCGGEDHTVKDCVEKLYCTVCNKDGHTANKCKRCHNCGGHHMLKECPLPRQCKQCGSNKHTANRCEEIIKKPSESQEPTKEEKQPSDQPNQEKKEESNDPEPNSEVAEFLTKLGMADYIKNLVGYDLEGLRKLSKDDYQNVGIPLGTRDQLIEALQK